MTDSYAAHQAAPGEAAAAVARLTHVHGVLELQAAILALLLPVGSKRAERAWAIETTGTPRAAELRTHVGHLSGPARLPWFEQLLERMALHPMPARQALMQSTRRVMGARGVARPIDRLHWLTMRRLLDDTQAAPPVRPDIDAEIVEWLESDVLALAAFSAFLSRLVPAAESDDPAGQAWYDDVMLPWQAYADIPAWQPTGSEAMVRALAVLQLLSLSQRPVIARAWVQAAARLSRAGRLADSSADALRMTCALLQTPAPPELTVHHADLDAPEPYLPS